MLVYTVHNYYTLKFWNQYSRIVVIITSVQDLVALPTGCHHCVFHPAPGKQIQYHHCYPQSPLSKCHQLKGGNSYLSHNLSLELTLGILPLIPGDTIVSCFSFTSSVTSSNCFKCSAHLLASLETKMHCTCEPIHFRLVGFSVPFHAKNQIQCKFTIYYNRITSDPTHSVSVRGQCDDKDKDNKTPSPKKNKHHLLLANPRPQVLINHHALVLELLPELLILVIARAELKIFVNAEEVFQLLTQGGSGRLEWWYSWFLFRIQFALAERSASSCSPDRLEDSIWSTIWEYPIHGDPWERECHILGPPLWI